MALLLVFFLYIGISVSGAVLLIVGESPPEMEPDKYRNLNLTHRYMSEDDWISWFHEQRKKLVLFTAGPPIIVIGFFFCRPLMFLHQRSINQQAGINVPPINCKFSVRKYALILSTIVLLSIGLALTVVGNVVPASFWLLRGC